MDTVPSATSVRFLSTPSARRATAIPILEALATGAFLSTPSVRRATKQIGFGDGSGKNFYPRPPRGGRPGQYAPPPDP